MVNLTFLDNSMASNLHLILLYVFVKSDLAELRSRERRRSSTAAQSQSSWSAMGMSRRPSLPAARCIRAP